MGLLLSVGTGPTMVVISVGGMTTLMLVCHYQCGRILLCAEFHLYLEMHWCSCCQSHYLWIQWRRSLGDEWGSIPPVLNLGGG